MKIKLAIGQSIILVVNSKREGNKEDVLVLAKVKSCYVSDDGEFYTAEFVKCLNKGSKGREFARFYNFTEENIDTGKRDKGPDHHPVFTEKEGCTKWLNVNTRR